MASDAYLTVPVESEKMPGGIPYIVGNEAAERFSFYGMKAILFVFMTEHIRNSAGEYDFMTSTEATTYIHLFVAATYLCSIIGGFLSDAFFGKYQIIISLSIVYCWGHLVLAIDNTRLGLCWGLMLIVVGAGGIKPCVSAHVGDQFGSKNQYLLPRVFSWFYFSINFGRIYFDNFNALFPQNRPGRLGPTRGFRCPGSADVIGNHRLLDGASKIYSRPGAGACHLYQIVYRRIGEISRSVVPDFLIPHHLLEPV